jgi:hypothetical protein
VGGGAGQPPQLPDRLVDQRGVGLCIDLVGDERCGSPGRSFGGSGAQLLNGGALFGCDLFLGHPAAALDQRVGVQPGLLEQRVRLLAGPLDHRSGFLFGRFRLFGIFGLERLCFLSKVLGFRELAADRLDLAIQRGGNRGRHFLHQQDREHE